MVLTGISHINPGHGGAFIIPMQGRQRQVTAWGLLATEPSLNCEHWVPVKDAGSKNKWKTPEEQQQRLFSDMHTQRERKRERREGKQEGEVG